IRTSFRPRSACGQAFHRVARGTQPPSGERTRGTEGTLGRPRIPREPRTRKKLIEWALRRRPRDDPKERAMADPVQFNLRPDDLPSAWYNILPDLPVPPLPPVHPATGEPIGPDALAPLFPMSLIMQEVSTERWHDIPGPVMD